MSKSITAVASLYVRLGQHVCATFLPDDARGSDLEHWRTGVLRIVLFALLLLCAGTTFVALADAWRLSNLPAAVLMLGSTFVLSLALYAAPRKPKTSTALVLLLIYLVGIWILIGARDATLRQLGLILLYAAPQVALIGFGIRLTLLLMLLNCIPLALALYADPVHLHTAYGNALPHSQAYVHLLLFLFFNVSMPLAFYCGYEALKRSVGRYLRSNKMLRRSNILYEDMFEHVGGPALICNQAGVVLKANQGAVALFSRELVEISQQVMLGDLLEAHPLGIEPRALLQLAHASGGGEGEFVVRGASSAGCEVLLRMKSLSTRCLLVGIKDITHLRTAQRELEAVQAARDRLISYDHLTNLPNLDHLRATLRELIARRTDNADDSLVAVACIRLNSIRSINEKFGPMVGDELICEFGRELSLRARPNIIPARLRSVVFSTLVTGYRDQDQLQQAVENLIADLPSHFSVRGQSIEISTSVGIAITRSNDIAVNELIHRSERALEAARKSRQRRMVVFSEDIGQEFHRETDVEIALSSALQKGELSLVYQPKVNAQRSIDGLEALLRWQSSELGNVSPAEFIPIAERNGKIHAITDFVIDSVCRQQRAWIERFGTTWQVAINLSGLDLQRENIATVILNAVKRHALVPALLQLEITETGLIESDEVARGTVAKLIDAGFHIAIDDFGTGYSSLKKLSEYPVDTIKIDRSFVLSIGENSRSEQIIRLILALAKFLNCETVAEGVETAEQLQFLIDNGCSRFQGYLFFKPLPVFGIEALLAQA